MHAVFWKSQGATVQVTNFCLWVTGKTYFLHIKSSQVIFISAGWPHQPWADIKRDPALNQDYVFDKDLKFKNYLKIIMYKKYKHKHKCRVPKIFLGTQDFVGIWAPPLFISFTPKAISLFKVLKAKQQMTQNLMTD